MNGSAKIPVRRVLLADVELVVPLFLAYLDFYRVTASETRVRTFLTERLERAESVIFIGDGVTPNCGFAQLYPGFSSLAQGRSWILEDLYVAPESRGHGVARALLARAERLAARTGAVRLALVTAVTNIRAQRLYEAAGWSRDDEFVTYERTVAPAE